MYKYCAFFLRDTFVYNSLCLSIRDRLHERHDGDSTDNKRQPGSHNRDAQYQPDHLEERHLFRNNGTGIPSRKMRTYPIRFEANRERGDALQSAAYVFILFSIKFSKYVIFVLPFPFKTQNPLL